MQKAALGIDFGATNFKLVVTDSQGNLLVSDTQPSTIKEGPELVLQHLSNFALQHIKTAQDLGYEIYKIGIGACGPVDHHAGEIIESTVLPGWQRVPLAAVVQKNTQLPVILDNDANVAVLGEYWRGNAAGGSVVAGFTLGTGIGGGLVIGGNIFRGAFGLGAEFGHIPVGDRSKACRCGGHGCLGAVASITATLDRYRELSGAGRSGLETIEQLADLAAEGDQAARAAINTSAHLISEAALVVVNCLNPDVLILAGGMAVLSTLLTYPVEQRIRTCTYKRMADRTKVVIGKLGVFSGAYGAALLAFKS